MNIEQFRAQLAAILMDPTNLTWDSSVLDAALRQALAAYTASCPHTIKAVVTLTESSRTVDLSSLTDLVDILLVEYPYLENGMSFSPGWQLFRDRMAAKLVLTLNHLPQPGEQISLLYTACHTIEGLDSAALTSVEPQDEPLLVCGAAGYAACSRALQRANAYEFPRPGSLTLNTWGRQMLSRFDAALFSRRMRSACQYALWTLE